MKQTVEISEKSEISVLNSPFSNCVAIRIVDGNLSFEIDMPSEIWLVIKEIAQKASLRRGEWLNETNA